MRIYLEEDALTYAYYDNYPDITFRIESADLNDYVDSIRKAKGYATLFDDTDPRVQFNGWYDIYIIINAETENIKESWAEIHGDVEEAECPDHDKNTYLNLKASDIVRQIKEQLRERYDVKLTDLKKDILMGVYSIWKRRWSHEMGIRNADA